MRLLLDTNRYRDLCEAVPAVVDLLQRAELVCIPFVVLAELRSGFFCGTRARKNEQFLTRFLNAPGIRQLFADEQTTHHYAQTYTQLRMQGTPIPTNDIWIAALAIQHDLLLFSRDQYFNKLPQVARTDLDLNWEQ